MADPSARDPGAVDIGPIIHEEIDRLPERYRLPILLCDIEERTRQEAAGPLSAHDRKNNGPQ